jgi:hypothetical protein
MLPAQDGLYEVHRMLPPGKHKYYYSVAGQVRLSSDQPTLNDDGSKPIGRELLMKKSRKESAPVLKLPSYHFINGD